jgi:hypothetical protein
MIRRFWARCIEKKLHWERVVLLIAALGLAVWFSIWFYGTIDQTPATAEEINEVDSLLRGFTMDPTIVYSRDGTLYTIGDEYIWEFQTSKMTAKATYDRNFVLVFQKVTDKALTQAGAIVTTSLVGLVMWLIFIVTFYLGYIIVGTLVVSLVVVIKDIRRRVP